jgi:asparagine synthase (glutamine-hydrolysing)
VTAILGIAGPLARSTEPRIARSMLGAMAHRGADRAAWRACGGAVLGTSRHHWELATTGGDGEMPALDGDVVVAADATLYYTADLRRALRARGVRATGATPCELILAAYRAWGADCAAHLEGDFAFVLWDATAQTLIAARDFGAKRPLHFAQLGGSILLASTIDAVRAHHACPSVLDAAVVAEEAGALSGSNTDTVWRGVKRIPPGHHLVWRASDPRHPRLEPHWQPPQFQDRARASDGADELLELLGDAVAERIATGAPTAVALSGGWDSPAVFAAGSRILERAPGRGSLQPISVSFPPGDPGREDELIESIVRHWKTATVWLASADIPALHDMVRRAALREEPFPHPFEPMNRAIARAAVGCGATVLLDGNGGDQLFETSSVYLADLVRRGRWSELGREWRARGGGARALVRDAMLPALPNVVLRGLDRMGDGRTALGDPLSRRPPGWMRADFMRAHGLDARERERAPSRSGRSLAATESAWQLTRPVLGRMASALASFTLAEGAEHRSPLYDRRIISFAATRPVAERRSAREPKRLLRRAMTGLLPREILAPRPARTGVPIEYRVTAIREVLPLWRERAGRESMLADLGIIDPVQLGAAYDRCLGGSAASHTVALYLALETELWLQAHVGGVRGRDGSIGAAARAASRAGHEWPDNLVAREDMDVRDSEGGAVRHSA